MWPPARGAYARPMEPGRRWRPDWRDAALALGSAVFLVVAAGQGRAGANDLDAFGYLLLVVASLVLVLRRRAPVAVLVVVVACVLGYQLRDYPEVAAVPVLIAVYTAVRDGRRALTDRGHRVRRGRRHAGGQPRGRRDGA